MPLPHKGITLIGMPGAGKSTVGKLLAEQLGFRFIDLDILIKEISGVSHSDILEQKGEKELLKWEEALTLGLDLLKTIFSPGGSIIYSARAMEKLRNETRVIYLKLPLEVIRRRLGGGAATRGIVGLKERGLDGLFSERTPVYESCAHQILDLVGLNNGGVVKKILDLTNFV